MIVVGSLVVFLLWGQVQGSLKLANYYSDHMVLQRGPQRAVLWGTADTEGDTVTAKVTGQGSAVTATVKQGVWKLKLPAITDPGPFVIDVTSADGHVTLRDVLFGDVWLCSGQSNMEFEMKKVMNTTAEVQRGLNFNTIRYMKTNWVRSNTPLNELPIAQKWTIPTEVTLKEFSAVCFLFAEYIQPHLNYPIGLVGSYWGGTTVETWSPPEAIQACSQPTRGTEPSCCPQSPLVLWNSKIYSLRSMTIKGALWYQGESNAGFYKEYTCQQQAMINEWRKQFHQQSLGETSANFPFGIVQIAANEAGDSVSGMAHIRWSQTYNHGYNPNSDLPNTFLAVAMDLPDYQSPYGTIHPRYKQEVARRLVLGALHVAYGNTSVIFQGPFPTHFTPDQAHQQLVITYDGGHAHLDVRNITNFEVCCENSGPACDNMYSKLIPAPVKTHTQSQVILDTIGCGSHPVLGVRYAWRTSPCDLKQCAVYDSRTDLPGPPFFLDVKTGSSLIG